MQETGGQASSLYCQCSVRKEEKMQKKESWIPNAFKNLFISQQGQQNPQKGKKKLLGVKKKSYITIVVVLQTSILDYKISLMDGGVVF